jgi:hypothetical protein
VQGSSPSEHGFCSSETKRQKNGAKNKIVCFGEEITGTKFTNPKTVQGSSLGEDAGFRDNNNDISFMIFNDIYRTIRPTESLRAIKIGKKCKDLSNFPAVTL